MEPSTCMKKIRCCTINEDAERWICDATHNPIYEGVRETNMDEYELNEDPTSTIKSLGKVNLKDGTFQTFELDRVQGFLSSANGFMNLPLIEEGKLFLGYMLGQYRLDMVGNDFGYDLVDTFS